MSVPEIDPASVPYGTVIGDYRAMGEPVRWQLYSEPIGQQFGTWLSAEPIVLTGPMGAQKARWGAVVGALAGAMLPGATYLLTVDGNGITGVEWLHAGLLAFAGACTLAGAVGGTVYAVENKPKED